MNQTEYVKTMIEEYFKEKYQGIDEQLGEEEIREENIFGNEETRKLEGQRELLEEVESELEIWIKDRSEEEEC